MQCEFINRFSYTRIDAPLGATALTEPDGRPLRDVVQGNIQDSDVLKGANHKMSLNFIIETTTSTPNSIYAIQRSYDSKSAKRFFESINEENINVQFSPQLKHDDIVALIKQVVAS
ncbi:hypothetical protein [Corynebacterium caspium]|uniref:hypothetical protein n=1 Tax=Corynebacterium caspium TaxID=234828 RepID=UPI000361879A|nr:hypothetical protein [Corynebacterium caspium]